MASAVWCCSARSSSPCRTSVSEQYAEEMAVHLELGQRVAELTDRRARRVVDEHLLRPCVGRDVVHQRHALVEEVPAAGLEIAAHPIARDALPLEAGDELAGNRRRGPRADARTSGSAAPSSTAP